MNMDREAFLKVFQVLIFFSFFFPYKVISNYANSSSSSSLCIEFERNALLKFKEELDDPSNLLSSWIPATDCCQWYGIQCDSFTGHVKKLLLANPGKWIESGGILYENSMLTGNLSDSILNLKHLSHIDLSDNDFGGIQIPGFLGSLVSLNYLNLSNSRFLGLIPHQLGNLSNLQRLGLRDYGLHSENLQWIHGLRSLISLDLSYANLSKVSDWLLNVNELPLLVELRLSDCRMNQISEVSHVNFTSLSILDISFNNFNTLIPKWIFTLGSLVSLDLSRGYFHGPLPPDFSNLTSLESLWLGYNNLNSSLPKSLFSFTSLTFLDLRSNNFEGPIPCGIQNLSTLTYLDLSWSNFNSTSIPICLYSLHSLQHLGLSNLNLKGQISNDIGSLTNLVSLELTSNKLEGNMPRSIGSLCNLRYIFLSNNQFDFFEIIPEGCLAKSLMELYLDGNNISGPIPELIGSLSSLIYLRLDHNKLNGTLPKSMGSLSNLQSLSISQNCLEGIVSDAHFANLINLKKLDLSQNYNLTLSFSLGWNPPFQLDSIVLSSCNLGPQFPKWLKSQRNFFYIHLSNAKIVDIVPDWFWRLSTSCYQFDLSHNQLSGELPDFYLNGERISILLGSNQFYGNLPRISSNVYELDLSNNLFSGNMSHFLCQSRKEYNALYLLNLENNLLSGNIPNCWKNWMSLSVVRLSSNNFSGNLPSSIGSLSILQALHLRNNNFPGKIPRFLENLSLLKILDLSLNAFQGSIPTWIGMNLSKLLFLGLRSNQLSGLIPNELCQLSSLQMMDIANNNLIGSLPLCFGNFTAMATEKRIDWFHIIFEFYDNITYYEIDNAYVVTKGKEFVYDKILGLMTSMDLSDNNLSGEIPHEITNLFRLNTLNLSGNHLNGSIPQLIGSMAKMESLDLSRNKLSGQIPQSISKLTFLSRLNLSYNNLSGQIPSSTQIQTLDPSSFIGNELCGQPLTNSCQLREEKTSDKAKMEEGDENYIDKWFYVCVAMGFVVGFWGIWGSLLISTPWRHKYFTFLNSICNKFN